MNTHRLVAPLIITAALLGGCTAVPVATTPAASAPVVIPTEVVRATGYGAIPQDPDLGVSQRRLLGMRAAKLEAIRNLVEQIYGLRIEGQSTVGAMAVRNDSFRTYIRTYVNGARVVSITPIDDQTFEATVELTLDQRFYSCAVNPTLANCGVAGMSRQGYQMLNYPTSTYHRDASGLTNHCIDGDCAYTTLPTVRYNALPAYAVPAYAGMR